jgi:hypothetical protein
MIEFDILLKVVNDITGINKDILISRKKIREISEVRMMCTTILHEYKPELKLKDVGEMVGLKYCSIIHHKKTHDNLMLQLNGKYKSLFQNIRISYKREMIKQDKTYKRVLIEKRKQLQFMLEEINQLLG